MADETNPVDFLPHLPPRTELEQLTAAFEAGLLTPALFALAKEKLLHPDVPAAAALPPPSRLPAVEEGAATAGELPSLMSFFNDPAPVAPTPAPAAQPAPPRVEQAPAPSLPAPAAQSSYLFGKEIEAASVAPAFRPPAAPPTTSQPVAGVDFLGTALPTPSPSVNQPPPQLAAAPRATLPAGSSIMPKVLLALGILGLLLLLYWQVAGSHPDEQLTSPHQPAASETSAAPVAARAHPRSRRTKATRPKKRKGQKNKQVPAPTDSVAATANPTTLAKAAATAAAPTEATPQPVPPAPEASDSEAIGEIRATIAGYYADMLAPPFTAARHFAPHVQRLYIQQNLTPADIDASFTRNFFPDNKQAVLQIEPGTLRVSAPAADGTRMATFVEASRVYHPSRQGYQRLRAQVRARFGADYKIVYLRQERLLESTLE